MPLDMTEWVELGEHAGKLDETWANVATGLGLAAAFLLVLAFAMGSDGRIVRKVRSFVLSLSFICMASVGALVFVAPMSAVQTKSFIVTVSDGYGVDSLQYNGSTNKEQRCFLNRPCATAESLPAEGEYAAMWIKDSEQISGTLRVTGNSVTLIGADGEALTPPEK